MAQSTESCLVSQIDGSTEDATSSSGNCQDDEAADSDVESCDDAFMQVDDDFAGIEGEFLSTRPLIRNAQREEDKLFIPQRYVDTQLRSFQSNNCGSARLLGPLAGVTERNAIGRGHKFLSDRTSSVDF